MSCMIFDHHQLVNLELSLQKEFLRSNRAGAFASSTLVYCNTRKHHGLLVCPISDIHGENHVLLSSFDETIIQEGQEFHLGIHKYPEHYHPLGHKYVESLGVEPGPNIIYKVGSVVLKKEAILSDASDQILIRYTLLDSIKPVRLKFHPFLAFRNIHHLTKENSQASRAYDALPGGVRMRMYEQFPYLNMQFSKNASYEHTPHWHHNIEYREEKNAGEACQEDLYVPGAFELELTKGESVVFSAATSEQKPSQLKASFNREVKKRVARVTYDNCLENAAEQFINYRNERATVVAGFPYFGSNGRDSLVALPGLTLYKDGDVKSFKAVFEALTNDLDKKSVFEALHSDGSKSADTPLWYIWAIQQYVSFKNSSDGVWKAYGKSIEKILNSYTDGTDQSIAMHDNKLIYAEQENTPLTWMDIVLDGQAINQRNGYAVEVNALWYNALRFASQLARKARATVQADKWTAIADEIPANFVDKFWDDRRSYLADFSNYAGTDWSIRPNMVFAASLAYSPISEDKRKAVLDTIRLHLVTKKGVRTLSPRNAQYDGSPSVNRREARRTYHQGNVFPWLFGHYIEGMFALRGKAAMQDAELFYHEQEKEMTRKGMGAISEYFHGNPPHEGRGAISQAWNTAELLRVRYMIKENKK